LILSAKYFFAEINEFIISGNSSNNNDLQISFFEEWLLHLQGKKSIDK